MTCQSCHGLHPVCTIAPATISSNTFLAPHCADDINEDDDDHKYKIKIVLCAQFSTCHPTAVCIQYTPARLYQINFWHLILIVKMILTMMIMMKSKWCFVLSFVGVHKPKLKEHLCAETLHIRHICNLRISPSCFFIPTL